MLGCSRILSPPDKDIINGMHDEYEAYALACTEA